MSSLSGKLEVNDSRLHIFGDTVILRRQRRPQNHQPTIKRGHLIWVTVGHCNQDHGRRKGVRRVVLQSRLLWATHEVTMVTLTPSSGKGGAESP